jgi:DNA-binding NarL/FixJ family response regulator
VNQVPTPAGAPAVPDAVPPVGDLPVQRVPEGTSAAPSRAAAVVLLADPRRASRVALSAGLRGGGRITDVLQAGSVAEVDVVIARGVPGDLALVSLAFGSAADRLIGDLRRAGWPRVLVTDRAAATEAVIRAFRAGAGGVLLGPPAYRRAYPAADSGPMPVLHLSDREIDVLQWVADGRTNRWIGERLSRSMQTVKGHLARIGRKLGTGDRAQMIAMAMRAGVIR